MNSILSIVRFGRGGTSLGLLSLGCALQAQITAVYLPPGPAIPARPPWAQPHRDIPWWFTDPAGAADVYDVSLIWAARYNGGGAIGYEAGIISPPSPLGNGGEYSTNEDRMWVSATTYPFSISYNWTGLTTAGPGVASITVNGSTSTADPGYVTDRVAAFVNGTQPTLGNASGPYAQTHTQRDLLIRLATATDNPTSGSMSITLSGLAVSINGGAAQNITYENGGTQTSLMITGTTGDATRSVGFLLLDDLVATYTDDFVLTGNLTYTLSGGATANGSRLMFEAKLGDFTAVPEASSYAAAVLGMMAVGGTVWRRWSRS